MPSERMGSRHHWWLDETQAVAESLQALAQQSKDRKMPSKTQSQARLMAAAAHTKGGYGGVPQKVGKEFNQADKGGKLLSKAAHKPHKAGRGK